ncbi:putative protein CLEC16A [Blattamonas nauphoetae]|uniref:FPL domain-containing protein n=1 Tax=Blattamonas nauphoetae TaxID=2049346 RepID=A0ABQ9YGQ1_9EUKA|nr:putative protein CLEC16A [Blattamonas nauphoetae]
MHPDPPDGDKSQGQPYRALSVLRSVAMQQHYDASVVISECKDLVHWILRADKLKDITVLNVIEKEVLPIFLEILKLPIESEIKAEIYQSLSVTLQNLKSEKVTHALFAGDQLNILLQLPVTITDFELISYYVSMLRALSFQMKPNNIDRFYSQSKDIVLPVLAIPTQFFYYPDNLIKTAARTSILKVLQHKTPNILNLISGPAPKLPFLHNLALYLKALCFDISVASFEGVRFALESEQAKPEANTDTYLNQIPVSICLSTSTEFQSSLTRHRFEIMFGEKPLRCGHEQVENAPTEGCRTVTVGLSDLLSDFTDTVLFLNDLYSIESLQLSHTLTSELVRTLFIPLARQYWQVETLSLTSAQAVLFGLSSLNEPPLDADDSTMSMRKTFAPPNYRRPVSTKLPSTTFRSLSTPPIPLNSESEDLDNLVQSNWKVPYVYCSSPLMLFDLTQQQTLLAEGSGFPSTDLPFQSSGVDFASCLSSRSTWVYSSYTCPTSLAWEEPKSFLGIPTSLCLYFVSNLLSSHLPPILAISLSALMYVGESELLSPISGEETRSILPPFTLLCTHPNPVAFLIPKDVTPEMEHFYSINKDNWPRAMTELEQASRTRRLDQLTKRQLEKHAFDNSLHSSPQKVFKHESGSVDDDDLASPFRPASPLGSSSAKSKLNTPLYHTLAGMTTQSDILDNFGLFSYFGIDFEKVRKDHETIQKEEKNRELEGKRPIEPKEIDSDWVINFSQLSEKDKQIVLLAETRRLEKRWEIEIEERKAMLNQHASSSEQKTVEAHSVPTPFSVTLFSSMDDYFKSRKQRPSTIELFTIPSSKRHHNGTDHDRKENGRKLLSTTSQLLSFLTPLSSSPHSHRNPLDLTSLPSTVVSPLPFTISAVMFLSNPTSMQSKYIPRSPSIIRNLFQSIKRTDGTISRKPLPRISSNQLVSLIKALLLLATDEKKRSKHHTKQSTTKLLRGRRERRAIATRGRADSFLVTSQNENGDPVRWTTRDLQRAFEMIQQAEEIHQVQLKEERQYIRSILQQKKKKIDQEVSQMHQSMLDALSQNRILGAWKLKNEKKQKVMIARQDLIYYQTEKHKSQQITDFLEADSIFSIFDPAQIILDSQFGQDMQRLHCQLDVLPQLFSKFIKSTTTIDLMEGSGSQKPIVAEEEKDKTGKQPQKATSSWQRFEVKRKRRLVDDNLSLSALLFLHTVLNNPCVPIQLKRELGLVPHFHTPEFVQLRAKDDWKREPKMTAETELDVERRANQMINEMMSTTTMTHQPSSSSFGPAFSTSLLSTCTSIPVCLLPPNEFVKVVLTPFNKITQKTMEILGGRSELELHFNPSLTISTIISQITTQLNQPTSFALRFTIPLKDDPAIDQIKKIREKDVKEDLEIMKGSAAEQARVVLLARTSNISSINAARNSPHDPLPQRVQIEAELAKIKQKTQSTSTTQTNIRATPENTAKLQMASMEKTLLQFSIGVEEKRYGYEAFNALMGTKRQQTIHATYVFVSTNPNEAPNAVATFLDSVKKKKESTFPGRSADELKEQQTGAGFSNVEVWRQDSYKQNQKMKKERTALMSSLKTSKTGSETGTERNWEERQLMSSKTLEKEYGGDMEKRRKELMSQHHSTVADDSETPTDATDEDEVSITTLKAKKKRKMETSWMDELFESTDIQMWSTVPKKKPVEPLAGTPTKHTHSGKSSPRTQSSQSTRSSSPTREELMIMFPERRLLDHPIVISSMSLDASRTEADVLRIKTSHEPQHPMDVTFSLPFTKNQFGLVTDEVLLPLQGRMEDVKQNPLISSHQTWDYFRFSELSLDLAKTHRGQHRPDHTRPTSHQQSPSEEPVQVVCVCPAFEYDCALMDILVDSLQAKPVQHTDSIQIPVFTALRPSTTEVTCRLVNDLVQQTWAMNTLYQRLYQQQQERIMNVMDEHRSKWTKKVTEIEKTEASHRPTDDLLEGIDCGSSELVQSLKTNTAWKKDLEWLYPQITSPPPPQLLWWHAEKVRAVFKNQLKSVESCIVCQDLTLPRSKKGQSFDDLCLMNKTIDERVDRMSQVELLHRMEERAITSVTPSPFLPFFVGMLNKRVEDNLAFNLDGVDRLQTVSEVNLTLFKALFSLSRKLPDTVRTLSQPSNTFACEPIHKPIDQDTFFSRISLLLPTQTTRHYTSEAPMPNQEKSVVEKCFDSLKMAVTTLVGSKDAHTNPFQQSQDLVSTPPLPSSGSSHLSISDIRDPDPLRESNTPPNRTPTKRFHSARVSTSNSPPPNGIGSPIIRQLPANVPFASSHVQANLRIAEVDDLFHPLATSNVAQSTKKRHKKHTLRKDLLKEIQYEDESTDHSESEASDVPDRLNFHTIKKINSYASPKSSKSPFHHLNMSQDGGSSKKKHNRHTESETVLQRASSYDSTDQRRAPSSKLKLKTHSDAPQKDQGEVHATALFTLLKDWQNEESSDYEESSSSTHSLHVLNKSIFGNAIMVSPEFQSVKVGSEHNSDDDIPIEMPTRGMESDEPIDSRLWKEEVEMMKVQLSNLQVVGGTVHRTTNTNSRSSIWKQLESEKSALRSTDSEIKTENNGQERTPTVPSFLRSSSQTARFNTLIPPRPTIGELLLVELSELYSVETPIVNTKPAHHSVAEQDRPFLTSPFFPCFVHPVDVCLLNFVRIEFGWVSLYQSISTPESHNFQSTQTALIESDASHSFTVLKRIFTTPLQTSTLFSHATLDNTVVLAEYTRRSLSSHPTVFQPVSLPLLPSSTCDLPRSLSIPFTLLPITKTDTPITFSPDLLSHVNLHLHRLGCGCMFCTTQLHLIRNQKKERRPSILVVKPVHQNDQPLQNDVFGEGEYNEDLHHAEERDDTVSMEQTTQMIGQSPFVSSFNLRDQGVSSLRTHSLSLSLYRSYLDQRKHQNHDISSLENKSPSPPPFANISLEPSPQLSPIPVHLNNPFLTPYSSSTLSPFLHFSTTPKINYRSRSVARSGRPRLPKRISPVTRTQPNQFSQTTDFDSTIISESLRTGFQYGWRSTSSFIHTVSSSKGTSHFSPSPFAISVLPQNLKSSKSVRFGSKHNCQSFVESFFLIRNTITMMQLRHVRAEMNKEQSRYNTFWSSRQDRDARQAQDEARMWLDDMKGLAEKELSPMVSLRSAPSPQAMTIPTHIPPQSVEEPQKPSTPSSPSFVHFVSNSAAVTTPPESPDDLVFLLSSVAGALDVLCSGLFIAKQRL